VVKARESWWQAKRSGGTHPREVGWREKGGWAPSQGEGQGDQMGVPLWCRRGGWKLRRGLALFPQCNVSRATRGFWFP